MHAFHISFFGNLTTFKGAQKKENKSDSRFVWSSISCLSFHSIPFMRLMNMSKSINQCISIRKDANFKTPDIHTHSKEKTKKKEK